MFRLNSYRQGDRSEYLAQFLLSRLSFVAPIPRQEDFGAADFSCFRAIKEGKRCYGKEGFLIQVKSSRKALNFKESFRDWILDNLDLPLLMCVADKKRNVVELFASWRIYYCFRLNAGRKLEKIVLKPGIKSFGNESCVFDTKKKVLTVALHEPVIQVSIDEIEKVSSAAGNVLAFWLDLERKNIANLRSHGAFFHGYPDWNANSIPNTKDLQTYYIYGYGRDTLEKFTVQYLTSQCVNLKHFRGYKRIGQIVRLLRTFPEKHWDGMTRFYTKGTYKKEMGKT